MTTREPNNCEMCKTVDELSPSQSYCPKHNYTNKGDDNMTTYEPEKCAHNHTPEEIAFYGCEINKPEKQSNYLDARTPEERANEPEGITTSNRETENWEELLREFLKQQTNNVAVLSNQSSVVNNKAIKSFIRSLLLSEKARLREKVEGMRKQKDPDEISYKSEHQRQGFNQALDEVKELLK